jgi:hypothetical protein
MISLDEIIEEHTGPELAIFRREVEALPQPLLADLVKGVMNYPDPHSEMGDRRGFLEIAAGEVTWAHYFDGYKKVTGHPSSLDTAMKYPHTVIEKDSTHAEWAKMRERLESLTEVQVKQIAANVGLTFTDPSGTTREDYIDILDEAYWDELARAYFAVAGSNLKLSQP